MEPTEARMLEALESMADRMATLEVLLTILTAFSVIGTCLLIRIAVSV